MQRRGAAGNNNTGGALAALAELCDYNDPAGVGQNPFLQTKRTVIPLSLTLPTSMPTLSAATASSPTIQQSSYISVMADHHHSPPPLADALLPTPITPRPSDIEHSQNTMVREILSASLSLAELSKSPVVFQEDASHSSKQPRDPPTKVSHHTRMPSISSESSASVSSSLSATDKLATTTRNSLAPSTISIQPRSQLATSFSMPPLLSNTSKKRQPATGIVQTTKDNTNPRFREYQVTTWSQRLAEVQAFVREHGHCMIPSDYPPNQKLAKWAKRQRCQYQLFQTNPSKSSMTSERIRVLSELGFCWQNKMSVWQARYQELLQFHLQFGHTQVPSSYPPNQRLATWVKCQRRQRRLRDRNKPSSMTDDRIALLDSVNFVWRMYPSNPRGDE